MLSEGGRVYQARLSSVAATAVMRRYATELCLHLTGIGLQCCVMHIMGDNGLHLALASQPVAISSDLPCTVSYVPGYNVVQVAPEVCLTGYAG